MSAKTLQELIDKCDRYCGVDARYHRDGCGLMKHNGEAALRLQLPSGPQQQEAGRG